MIKCFQILTTLFQKCIVLKIDLPDTFDFKLTSQVLQLALGSDHCVVIVKVLLFLYYSFPLLPDYFIARLSLLFIRDHFVPLFAHWSPIVRNVLHHFVWFRLFQASSLVEEELYDIL